MSWGWFLAARAWMTSTSVLRFSKLSLEVSSAMQGALHSCTFVSLSTRRAVVIDELSAH